MGGKGVRTLLWSIVAIALAGSVGAIAASAAVGMLGLSGIAAALVAVPLAMIVTVAMFAAGVQIGNVLKRRS